MSVIATITVPSSSFSIGSLVEEDGTTVRVETTVPTAESVVPYLWVPTDATDSVVSTLESEPTVERVAVVDEADGTTLVKVGWTDDVNGVLESIRESDAVVTDAVGDSDRWTFRLRFPTYESLSAFYTRCRDAGVEFDLVRLHEVVSGDETSRFGLTEPQRRLILTAHEAGYFDVPRRTTRSSNSATDSASPTPPSLSGCVAVSPRSSTRRSVWPPTPAATTRERHRAGRRDRSRSDDERPRRL